VVQPHEQHDPLGDDRHSPRAYTSHEAHGVSGKHTRSLQNQIRGGWGAPGGGERTHTASARRYTTTSEYQVMVWTRVITQLVYFGADERSSISMKDDPREYGAPTAYPSRILSGASRAWRRGSHPRTTRQDGLHTRFEAQAPRLTGTDTLRHKSPARLPLRGVGRAAYGLGSPSTFGTS
jgi:hypothetical protein